MMHGSVPIASYGMIAVILRDINKPLVIKPAYHIHRSVSGIVIHHYHIVSEIRLL